MNRLANKGIPTANISTALPRLAARLCLTLLVIAITVSCRSIPAEAALRDEQFTGSVQSVPMTALDMS
ncbi:MAG: hypothetical protein LBU99_02720 [Spirochaetaceae bacterium]|nr:hypothetical protein [Spirochaetaceae bacterium]